MKSLLIKSGKAWNALRQEGAVRGGKRVVKSFIFQFGRVGSGDILFITPGVGDSARFRAHHQAEELNLHGFQCSVTIQDNPFLATYAKKFKVFVFHRTLNTSRIRKLIENIKKASGKIIFDTDDLIFDKKYVEQSNHFEKMNAFERMQYDKGVGAEILLDPYVEVCTTSTTYLASILEGYGKKVFVSKNKLSLQDLEVADKILEKAAHNPSQNSIIIGYFSGTKGHDRNFATVESVLLRILGRYSQVKLFLAGPLNISSKFAQFENKIERTVFVPRKEHFRNISRVDINIIPLEISNPFCEAKSELKFFEAGIMGVPSVAANNQTYREAIKEGIDGFLAASEIEWHEKLEKLIINHELRKSLGENARKNALQDYTTKNSHNKPYYEYLQSLIGN